MKTLSLTIGLLIGLSSFAQTTHEMSLEQAVAYARTNSTSLKNAELDIKMAEAQVKNTIAIGLPQVNANGTFVHNVEIASQQLPDFLSPAVYGVLINEGLVTADKFKQGDPQTVQFGAPSMLMGSLKASQLLFDGTYFLGLKAAREYVQVSSLAKENAEINLVEATTKAYYGALLAESNVSFLEKSLKTIENTFNETEEMYKAGVIEKLDVDRIRLTKSNLETQLNNMSQQADVMNMMLKLTIGMPIVEQLSLTDQLESLLGLSNNGNDFSIENRIEYQLLEQQLTLDKMNVKRYQIGYIPSLYFQFEYQQNSFAEEAEFKGLGNTWNPGTNYAVNLSIPIFDGLGKQAKISEARLQVEKDENQLENTKNLIAFQVAQAQRNYEAQVRTFENQKSNKTLATDIYKSAKIKFQEGVGSSLELTQAENDKTQSEINYSNALYQLVVAKLELEKALGNLK